jgi:enamine deaminase RidA (YjgF/YER057c/UK114 family)
LPAPPVPGAQYVPTIGTGRLLFVSGHDPERHGRLVYRGRVGREVTASQARAAIRLATLNALASADAALGSLRRVRRAVALACFVDAGDGALPPGLAAGALALLRAAFGAGRPPVVWLRSARGLAGGMPVEVELVLELRA